VSVLIEAASCKVPGERVGFLNRARRRLQGRERKGINEEQQVPTVDSGNENGGDAKKKKRQDDRRVDENMNWYAGPGWKSHGRRCAIWCQLVYLSGGFLV
jgi:hypothetical protein